MIVAIDTSSAISVSITDAEATATLAHRSVFAPRGHAEQLSELIRQAMAESGVTGPDVTAIVVGTGPAPFTGLRVGLVTARMLAYSWGVPVWGVCSLDALGAEVSDAVVVGDARRREVYWARYVGGERVEGPVVVAPAQASVCDGERVLGRGAVLYPESFPGAVEADPDPLWLAREALRRRSTGEELGTEPLYLRRPDVHGT
jgi:tRNA threonylcarbamoyladenosine biosynthesis protein TsaB